MSNQQRLSVSDFIQQHINNLIHMKGQIDSIISGMDKNDPFYKTYTWIQGLVNVNLNLSYLVQQDNAINSIRISQLEKLLRKLLAADDLAPQEELIQRSEDLGAFYGDLRKRGKGET